MKQKLRIFALMAMLLCFAFQANAQVSTEAALKEAITTGGNVILDGDIEVAETIEVPAGVTTTLDLNGYAITSGYQSGSDSMHIYPFDNHGTFTIKDSEGTGSITGRGIYNQDGATITVDGAKIVSEDWNGGAGIWGYGATSKVYLNNATIIGNTGVVSSEGYLEINGGTYTCYSGIKDDGTINSPTYNIRAYSGLKITDGTFTSRHGVISVGGGEAVIEDGSYTIEFAAATTSNVVYVYNDAELTINGGEFISDNTSGKADSGTAVLVSGTSATLIINDGTFVGMNGMVSINDNTVINGGSFDTVWDYNHYGAIESAVATDAVVTVAGTTYTKTEDGLVEATFVAKIGSATYTTFGDAMTAANAMTGDVTVEIYGKVEYTDATANLTGAYDNINFVGKTDDAEISITRDGSNGYISGVNNDCTVNFTNLKLSKPAGAFAGDAGFMNVAFTVYRVGAVNYTGCTFLNGACGAGCPTIYTNCTFNKSNEKYCLWAYGADVHVDECVFDADRGIKMYAEGAAKTTAVTVTNSDFSKLTGKPAIVLTYGESVTLEGNTYSSTGVFELDLNGAPNGTTVTSDVAPTCKNDNGTCGVLVDGKIYTTVTEAVAVATEGSNVTLLYTTEESVEFAEGVNLTLADGVTAENVTVKVSGPVEVADFAALKTAVEAGKSVKLTADITTTDAIVTSGVTSIIDLNGKTLTIGAGDNKFNDESNITIENGTISITDVTVSGNAIFCLDEYETSLVTTLTLNNVNLVGDGYSSAYGVFYIGKSSVLNVNGGVWSLANDTHTNGGVFKADASTATLNIDGLQLAAHNVRRGVTYAATTIANSTITFTGDADEVDAEMEHGFNRSPLAISNSTITMTDMVGRGITAENGAVTISDNSTVTMTNCQEATIDVRNNQTVTISDNSTVTLDAEPTITSGTINGTVVVPVTGLQGEGTEASPFLINNLEELVWFRDQVDSQATDGSTQFAGKYFKLTADIDLAGINWNPIGSMSGDHGSFKGVFDGGDFTISNLNVEQEGQGIGLFARTAGDAVIKNLKLNNVSVKSTNNSNYAGGLVGNAYASTKIENVHVSGDVLVSASGYIGGIAGHGYVVMDNVSVVGNEGSLITSTSWCAGGILGYGGEGTTNITNAHVEGITVTSAAGGLGAIVGMAEDNNGTQPISGSNLSAKDVEIKTYVGAYGTSYEDYAMGYLYGGNPTSELTGELVVENVTVETASGNPASVNDAVASVNGAVYFDLATAVIAAAPNKTVTLLRDVTVDEWVMFSETLSIGNGNIITTEINGLTINGNGKTVTIKDVESAGNGARLFYDATNLNINNLTFNFVDNAANLGGIGLTSGTIKNVTFNGGGTAIFPGTGDVTIEGCTFKTDATSIYYEEERDYLVVTGNTFENPDNVNVILLRGNTVFTDNKVISGRTVNVVSGSPVVTGNNFNDVRFKVYNVASATIEDNTINTLAFNDESVVYSTFESNILSEAAQAVLDAATFPAPVAKVGDVEYTSLQEALNAAVAGTGNVTVTILEDVDLTGVIWNPVTVSGPGYPVVTVEGNGKKITGLTDMLFAATWAGGSGLIIKDLTIENSAIVNDENDSKGTVGVGAFIGYPQASATITLENCHLVNSSVKGGHWTGGLIGMAGGYNGNDGPVFMNLTIKGCSVTGSTITGKGSVGGIIGHGSCAAWTNVVIEETTVENNIITSTGSSNVKAGAVMGTIGAAGQDATANGVTMKGGATVSATVAGNTVTSNGTEVTTIYGRQGTSTGMLYVAGGSYDKYPIEENVAYAAPVEGYEIVENADGTYGVQEILATLAGLGTEEEPFLINNVDDLKLFRNSVNAEETKYNAAGVYVALGADIDLAGEDWSVNIGDDCNTTFDGIFDGKNHTIKNLTSTETAQKGDGYICTGLFGAIYGNAVVKNLTIENVTIDCGNFTGNNVAAVVGFAYNVTGSIENVKVVGDINISAPAATGVGVIVGYDYYSPALKIESCQVIGNSGPAVVSGISYTGGLIGYASTKAVINNNVVENAAIKAKGSVAAVAGIMLGGGSATDNTVKNVTIETTGELWGNSAAVVAGTISGGSVTVSNTTVENVTANGAQATIVGGILVEKPTTLIAKVQARIGDVYYTTIAAAITAAAEVETITLLADVEVDYALNITCGLNLNGYSLVASVEPLALPDGFAALQNLDGNYVVGAKPTATVNNLGATTVAADDYKVYGNGDNTTEMPLSFVMQFLADQTEEDMAASPYADWYGDFVITFTGLNDSFIADGCYLAGHYGSFGWVKVPVDGMTIEEGVRYPVMLGVGMGQKYDYICSSVQDFRCALYLTPEVLEANPNIQVNLELAVVDNSKGEYAATEALVNNENVYSVTDYTYNAEDFVVDENYIAELTIDDAEGLDYTNDTDKTVGTLTYKRTLIEGIWNPLYLPFDIELTEELLENYEFADYNQMISIDSNGDRVPDEFEMELFIYTAGTLNANYPYFVRPKNAEACALEIVQEDAILYAAKEISLVTSSVKNTFKLSGTYKTMGASDLEGSYAISTDGDWALTESLKPHRLYFTITDNNGAAVAYKAIRLVVRGEDGFEGTTGIEEVETESAADDVIYDLSGRRVLEPAKGGIYIIDGKKVIF